MKLTKQKFNILNKLTLIFMCLLLSSNVSASCNLKLNETTPIAHFTFNNNGTVTHNTTNLLWKLCPEGQTWSQTTGCIGEVSRMDWSNALSLVGEHNGNVGFAGYTDWRLPNIKELGSIVERSCYMPAVNNKVFSSLNGYFWSSTPDVNNSGTVSFNVWLVNFDEGTIETRPNTGTSWSAYESAGLILVRDNQ